MRTVFQRMFWHLHMIFIQKEFKKGNNKMRTVFQTKNDLTLTFRFLDVASSSVVREVMMIYLLSPLNRTAWFNAYEVENYTCCVCWVTMQNTCCAAEAATTCSDCKWFWFMKVLRRSLRTRLDFLGNRIAFGFIFKKIAMVININ